MVKVVVNNGQFKITIPKELALERRWNKNTRLKFVEDSEGNLILKEVKLHEKK
jgi:bifunctional DNA-binding transcriptional regulator/antitoxin component of YhaV-PrlF toxin-antitoxin module